MDTRAFDIKKHLEELERLVRAQGDERAADLLLRIIKSSDPSRSFRLALFKNRKDCVPSRRETWFTEWPDRKLSRNQVAFLASVTRNWELDDDALLIISAHARLWISKPWEFWFGPKPDNDILKRCYNDSKFIQEVIPTRGKVISMITAQEVAKEQESIIQTRNGRKRCRAQTYGRNTSFLSSALKNICRRHWGDESKFKWLRTESRSGSKWLDLENPALVLSLYKINSDRYCKHGWTEIEVKALNAFAATLPQMSIYALLEKAFNSVVEYYQSPDPSPRGNFFDGTASQSSMATGPLVIQHQIPATAQEDEEAARLLSNFWRANIIDHQANHHASEELRTQSADRALNGELPNSNALSTQTPTTGSEFPRSCAPQGFHNHATSDQIRSQHFAPLDSQYQHGADRAAASSDRPLTTLIASDELSLTSALCPHILDSDYRDERHEGVSESTIQPFADRDCSNFPNTQAPPPLRVPETNRTEQSEQVQDRARASSPSPVSSLLPPNIMRPVASPGCHTFENGADSAGTTQQPLNSTPVLSDPNLLPRRGERPPEVFLGLVGAESTGMYASNMESSTQNTQLSPTIDGQSTLPSLAISQPHRNWSSYAASGLLHCIATGQDLAVSQHLLSPTRTAADQLSGIVEVSSSGNHTTGDEVQRNMLMREDRRPSSVSHSYRHINSTDYTASLPSAFSNMRSGHVSSLASQHSEISNDHSSRESSIESSIQSISSSSNAAEDETRDMPLPKRQCLSHNTSPRHIRLEQTTFSEAVGEITVQNHNLADSQGNAGSRLNDFNWSSFEFEDEVSTQQRMQDFNWSAFNFMDETNGAHWLSFDFMDEGSTPQHTRDFNWSSFEFVDNTDIV